MFSTTGMRPSAQRTVGRRHRSAFEVTKRSDIATTTQGAKKKKYLFLREMFHRPSDRRGFGSDPKPQCAFKISMFNVSCNSH